jgi:predicted nucleotidyltransferase
VHGVRAAAELLAARYPNIVAIGLAGSWARGKGGPDSDVDLIVLTRAPAELLDDDRWIALFDTRASLVSTRDFGAIQERRLRLADGLEVEVGVGRSEWASTGPVDEGTARVASDGIVPIFDPDGLLAGLLAEVAAG